MCSSDLAKLYKYKCSSKKNKKLIQKFDDISKNQSIKIETLLSCGYTSFILLYKRDDFMIGKIDFVINGKNGVQEQLIKYKLTFLSYLYYLCK